MARRRTLGFDPIDEAKRNWRGAGWDGEADGMGLVTSIMRAHQILLARVDGALVPFGLTFARYEVLMLLRFSRHGELPLGKVGERLQVHPASVTNVIDRLEVDGLVRRIAHPTDGRRTLARITDAGREVAGRATAALNRDVFGEPGVPADALGPLFDGLAELRRSAGDFA